MCVKILDWLLSLNLEVSLIWESRWNVLKVLYLLARYLPFVDVGLSIIRSSSNPSIRHEWWMIHCLHISTCLWFVKGRMSTAF
ncbi:hypothetical protein AN958_04752 [Leucoagaricus sp. SymC.cos]|nr:hypothetical protein AN958_12364 [Leucoagaricus sp. SymC.cos]KXN92798.1 hypothetical protein AN958_04752 [Leucoagaricus sp. SymC.cos]